MSGYFKPVLGATNEQLCELMLLWFSVLRKIGFISDELFVSPAVLDLEAQTLCIGWVVRVEGCEKWHMAVGTTTEDAEVFLKRWLDFDVMSVSDDRLRGLWKEHITPPLVESLLLSLSRRGLPLRLQSKFEN